MKSKYVAMPVALIALMHPLTTRSAFAVTVEVAKKCQALSAKAFPPRVPGNPAAGFAHGTAQEASQYFKKCVANGGNMSGTDNEQSPQEKN